MCQKQEAPIQLHQRKQLNYFSGSICPKWFSLNPNCKKIFKNMIWMHFNCIFFSDDLFSNDSTLFDSLSF